MGAFPLADNTDTGVPTDNLAAGPMQGFLGSLSDAFTEASTFQSQFGAVNAMRDAEQQNMQRVKAAGASPPQALAPEYMTGPGRIAVDEGAYADFVKAMGEYTDFPDTPDAAGEDAPRKQRVLEDAVNSAIGERDNALRLLQKKYPDAGIKTYQDMFSDMRDSVNAAVNRANNRPKTIMGQVGGLAGGLAGSVNPSTNPINFLSLGFGGGAKTILGRVAVQAGGQAVSRALDVLTGANANEAVFGAHPSATDSLLSVGEAGLQGAEFAGLGELGGLALRGLGRWFRPGEDVPEPPPANMPRVTPEQAKAAVPPPMSGVDTVIDTMGDRTRFGRSRAETDIRYAGEQLKSWSVTPEELTPITATRVPPYKINDAELPETWRRLAASTDGVDVLARQVDPDAFVTYDKLAADVNTLRDTVKMAGVANAKAMTDARATVDDQLAIKRAQLAKAKQPKKQARIQREIDDLEQGAQKAGLPQAEDYRKAVAGKIQELDEKMRDMAPTISRAYARARGQWSLEAEQRAQINDMVAKGKPGLSDRSLNELIGRAQQGAVKSPMPQRLVGETNATPPTDEPMKTGNKPGVADALVQGAKETAETNDKGLEQFRQSIAQALGDKNEAGTVKLEGIPQELKLTDTIDVPNEDGTGQRTITIRQALQELQEDEETLKAVSSCSIAKTS